MHDADFQVLNITSNFISDLEEEEDVHVQLAADRAILQKMVGVFRRIPRTKHV